MNLRARFSFAVASTIAKTTPVPSNCLAAWSHSGKRFLQCPHHGATNATMNASSALPSISSKFRSSKLTGFDDVDFCFLDGGHTYETVKNDLNIILNKIKKKSLILIDDYNQSHYGVKKAVDEIKDNYYHEVLGRFILIRNN